MSFKFITWLILSTTITVAKTDSAQPNTKIVHGEDAASGQIPYQALIKITFPDGKAICGGCLLSDQWIVTAAHCVNGASEFEVHLGGVTYSDDTEGGRVIIYTTESYLHEKYNPILAANDIALLKLPTSVELSNTIQPVKLPSVRDDYNGREAIVSGWGLTRNNGQIANVLQFAPLKVITHMECKKYFNSLFITSTTLCAKGEQFESVCQGDSGGPLVLIEEKILVGLTSFGHISGCESGKPSVFTRVSSYVDWISRKTGIFASL